LLSTRIVLVVETLNSIESAVVVSDQSVITVAVGKTIFAALIVLGNRYTFCVSHRIQFVHSWRDGII